ncbi:MAG: NAD-dependent epimerase/dehydratase family protein [Patescibacteria group bacterium]
MATNVEIENGMKPPILVTGASGFIGSHLVRRLVRDGHRVAILLQPDSDVRRIKDLLPSLEVRMGDIANPVEVEKALHGLHPRGVFHLAARLTRIDSETSAEEFIRVNTLGTIWLLQALREDNYQFFIQAGSSLEYGIKKAPLQERNQCEPTVPYGLAKLTASLYCQAFADAFGKPITVFRIFTPYGPGMERGKLMEVLVSASLRNEDIRLTSPAVNRDLIFISDVIEILVEAMEKSAAQKGEIFNLASGQAVTLAELVDLVIKQTGSKSKVLWGSLEQPPHDSGCQAADMAKTFCVFSWRPKYSLEDGVKKMIEADKSIEPISKI